MILSTITLNPAVDKTYYVRNFAINGLNRVDRVKVNMGGKGVNVAVAAAKCGISCTAGGFLSGYNGQLIGKYVKEAGITADFVYTEGDTRINIKIVDTENQTYTDINESGPEITPADVDALFAKVADIAIKSDYVYVGGSFHPCLGNDIYKRLIEVIKEKGAKAVLDADGEALRLGITACPHIIKPNQEELEGLVGAKIKTIADVSRAAKELADGGVETVLVSLGGNGAVAASGGRLYRIYPLNASVRSTVGAGDSFLCGFLYGQTVSEDISVALRYAMAFATAKIQTEGTDIPSFESLRQDFEKVTVEIME